MTLVTEIEMLPIRNPLLRLCSGQASPIRNRSEAGVIFITTLLLMALLLILTTSGLVLSRTDLLISRNLITGTQALWLARAGLELGKNWLETNLSVKPLPVTLGPEELANGTYTVSVTALGSGVYHLTALGSGPGGSERTVEEVFSLPAFTPAAAITSVGDGLHLDFDDNSGGTGRRIPDFNIDGRNHAPNGNLSPLCPDVSPFATTQIAARNDLLTAADALKRELVTRANDFCLADGSDAAGTCTPGLSWVRGSGASPRFINTPCVATDPLCFLNLDLSASALRATAQPPDVHLPTAPEDRGPFTPGTVALPFVRSLSATEQTDLQTALDEIIQNATALPEEKILHLTSSLSAGVHSYGTLAAPKITRVEDDSSELDIEGGAVVNGAGVLIIPRVVRLKDATLNWQGIILIVGDGDLRVEDPAACGQVMGAVVIRDDATPDRKLDLDRVERSGGCTPLTINYSCEAVTRALTVLMRTISWIERIGT